VLVNGVGQATQNPPAETVSVIDLTRDPPRVTATFEAPATVAAPPMGVAVAAESAQSSPPPRRPRPRG